MNEEATIASARQGDVRAFNRLVLSYQAIAYNVAYRILGDVDSAADATQEAFISAFQGISRFRGGAFRAWLLRIVTNACYDQLRRKQRRPANSLDAILTDPEHSSQLANGRDGPESLALRGELGGVIQRGIESLPPEQRIAVVLRDIQGLSYEEIAATTCASLGTVKSRLSRGRAGLRDYLMGQKELLPPEFRLNTE
jgi:RNA polymerase sigma-70 factor (ECF subfamily)